jgi:hypothetical protein
MIKTVPHLKISLQNKEKLLKKQALIGHNQNILPHMLNPFKKGCCHEKTLFFLLLAWIPVFALTIPTARRITWEGNVGIPGGVPAQFILPQSAAKTI